MKKTWKLGNGFNHVNDYGQSVLCEVGPSDFDANYEETERAAAGGIKPPYHREGSYYVFPRKRDWLEAIETLRKMAADGASAGEIGAQSGLSRNAVIGKASRLGIKLLGNNKGPRGSQENPAPKKPRKAFCSLSRQCRRPVHF